MAMTPKEKEPVANSILVAAGCQPRTDRHVKLARKARPADELIRRVGDDTIGVRRGAADIMDAGALAHLGVSHDDISKIVKLAAFPRWQGRDLRPLCG